MSFTPGDANHPGLARLIQDDQISVDMDDLAQDEVTGFRGRVTAVSLYGHASARILLEKVVNDKLKCEWFDAARIKPAPGGD